VLVLGIDPASTHLALVATNPLTQTFVAHKERLAKRSGPEACAAAMTFMPQFLDQIAPMGTPRYCFIEHNVRGPSMRSTIVQAHTTGVVLACLALAGFSVYQVAPTAWKATVTGNSRAEKPQVVRVVKAKWAKAAREIAGDYDLSDAAAICLYGVSVTERGAKLSASL
jgi:Holliday junction resolvasome RuvABC endonuclease subunit